MSSGHAAAYLFDVFRPIFERELKFLYDSRNMQLADCNDNIDGPCNIKNIGYLFNECLSNCYNKNINDINDNSPPMGWTEGADKIKISDDTTPGCGLSPTNVRSINPIACSSYPEYRWPYSASGTPSTNGMIPPTIVEGTCVAPMSDGCWASFGSGNGQSNGYVSTLTWQGTTPPASNDIFDIYTTLTSSKNSDGTVTIYDHEEAGDNIYVGSPSIQITIKSKSPLNEDDPTMATYINLIDATYVTGYVNNIVSVILSVEFVDPGVITFQNSKTGSSSMYSQNCYISHSFNCSVSVECYDTPCVVLFNAKYINSTINGYMFKALNIPEECYNCNSGGSTESNTYDPVGSGCFLFCCNFSGIGGFFGALVEWAIICFIFIFGLFLLFILRCILIGFATLISNLITCFNSS
jgi:hypothetical protein